MKLENFVTEKQLKVINSLLKISGSIHRQLNSCVGSKHIKRYPETCKKPEYHSSIIQ